MIGQALPGKVFFSSLLNKKHQFPKPHSSLKYETAGCVSTTREVAPRWRKSTCEHCGLPFHLGMLKEPSSYNHHSLCYPKWAFCLAIFHAQLFILYLFLVWIRKSFSYLVSLLYLSNKSNLVQMRADELKRSESWSSLPNLDWQQGPPTSDAVFSSFFLSFCFYLFFRILILFAQLWLAPGPTNQWSVLIVFLIPTQLPFLRDNTVFSLSNTFSIRQPGRHSPIKGMMIIRGVWACRCCVVPLFNL